MPVPVTRNRADGAVLARFVLIVSAATSHGEGLLQGVPALLREEIGCLLEGDTVLSAKLQGALADQEDVVGFFHDGARGKNGIARTADARNRRQPRDHGHP